jgi:hypothetical protein
LPVPADIEVRFTGDLEDVYEPGSETLERAVAR